MLEGSEELVFRPLLKPEGFYGNVFSKGQERSSPCWFSIAEGRIMELVSEGYRRWTCAYSDTLPPYSLPNTETGDMVSDWSYSMPGFGLCALIEIFLADLGHGAAEG